MFILSHTLFMNITVREVGSTGSTHYREKVKGIAFLYGLSVLCWNVFCRNTELIFTVDMVVRLSARRLMNRSWGRTGTPLFENPRPDLEPTQPLTQYVSGEFSPEINLPRRDADNALPKSTDLMNVWNYLSTPPYTFISCTDSALKK